MENLPEEIVTEILARLPAESMIQCKLVRKSWYHLFTDPNFISRHVVHQRQIHSSPNLVFLKRRVSCELNHEIMCVLSNDNIDDPEIVNLPSSIQQLSHEFLKLIGHCDGLIAFSDDKDGIIVCNFTTSESRILPASSFGLIPYDVVHDDHGDGCYGAHNNMIGFGYDNRINDYKIVRVVSFYRWEPGSRVSKNRVEVFSIRTDSRWRELDVVLDSSLTISWNWDWDAIAI